VLPHALPRPPRSDALAPFVDLYWIVRWDLRGQAPHEQTILPHPNVNLCFEQSGAWIDGVDRRLFVRRLSGLGHALGVRLRAGCFRPFWRAPASQMSDRVVPAAGLSGSAGSAGSLRRRGGRSWRLGAPPLRWCRSLRGCCLLCCRSAIRWQSRPLTW